MITIVDYGMGNLRSVSKALEALGASVQVSSDPEDIAAARKLVLPGVGAFPAAMRELAARGLIEPVKAAIARGIPYLGVCLGLQLLFERSDEGEGAVGLGVLKGDVRKFKGGGGLKVPHMGWNRIDQSGHIAHSRQQTARGESAACPLLSGIKNGSFFYFVHSYYAQPADHTVVALETDYGGVFTSMVWRGNLYATQFHPEKSQAIGLTLLGNFVKL